MTESAGITISQFIAGALAVVLALAIIPTIVRGSLGATTGAVNKQDAEAVYSKLKATCNGNPGDTIEGQMSLGPKYEVVIEGSKYKLLKNGEVIEEKTIQDRTGTDCTLDGGEKELNGTRTYKIRRLDENSFKFVE
ncbi:MAG: hypothetical protein ABEJ93_01760 [Candidatus Nanohalobium sp.]